MGNWGIKFIVGIVFLGSSLNAFAADSSAHNVAKGFVAYQQVDENACWAATTQMILKFKNPSSNVSQCEIASKVRGYDCCALDAEKAAACYTNTSAQDAWAAFGLEFNHIEKKATRWPIDPEVIIAELKLGHVVLLRWNRGEGRSTHVNLVAGYGEENGQRYLYIPDSAVGELKLFEENWETYFPHITADNIEGLAVPYAYRAFSITR